MSIEKRALLLPEINLQTARTVVPGYHFCKGARVDIVLPDPPYYISNHQILLAVKRNTPGFWDEKNQYFSPTPEFLEDQNQLNHPKHSLETFAREKEIMKKLIKNISLKNHIPLVFNSDPHSVVTEFHHGTWLENLIENPEFGISQRENVILQLCDFIYHMHMDEIIHHNDFHDKNQIITPEGSLIVMDFGMAGNKNSVQPEKWWDINQLNKTILRLVKMDKHEILRAPEPEEFIGFNRLKTLISGFPFNEENFYDDYRKFLELE